MYDEEGKNKALDLIESHANSVTEITEEMSMQEICERFEMLQGFKRLIKEKIDSHNEELTMEIIDRLKELPDRKFSFEYGGYTNVMRPGKKKKEKFNRENILGLMGVHEDLHGIFTTKFNKGALLDFLKGNDVDDKEIHKYYGVTYEDKVELKKIPKAIDDMSQNFKLASVMQMSIC